MEARATKKAIVFNAFDGAENPKPAEEAMSGTPEKIHIRLIDPFRVISKSGKDLTPRNNQVRALLAPLATAPEYRRSRAWLQDKLWSDRVQEQGRVSLR